MTNNDRIEALEEVLRSLACSLSVGGYNALEVDPGAFERKIRWGIDHIIDCERSRYTQRLTQMRLMLAECASLFREYEAHHRAKGDGPETTARAERNAQMALRIEQMFDQGPEPVPQPDSPTLLETIDALRALCATAYNAVSVHGGSTEMLENLAAAATGAPLPHEIQALTTDATGTKRGG